jgi:hypothetical protein
MMRYRATSGQTYSVVELIARGYRVTSRKHVMLSRIDRPDWKRHMANLHSPWSVDEGLEWVAALGDYHAEDHYRRVYSQDKLEFECRGATTLRHHVPNSNGAITGYVE